ncbi:MAG TPA: radical SAM protein, partial [Pyrinomonadaceae bacterium]|nr:radical SAM protein [Pyrinomonadaceae bacterium]
MNVFTQDDKFTLELTQRCPNRCLHCSTNSDPSQTTTIAIGEATRLIDEAVELGAKNIVLSGGEPLVYEGLIPLIEHVNTKSGVRIIVYTSGAIFAAGSEPTEIDSTYFET